MKQKKWMVGDRNVLTEVMCSSLKVFCFKKRKAQGTLKSGLQTCCKDTSKWSCRLYPTPGRWTFTGIPSFRRSLAFPIPDKFNICGILIAPEDKKKPLSWPWPVSIDFLSGTRILQHNSSQKWSWWSLYLFVLGGFYASIQVWGTHLVYSTVLLCELSCPSNQILLADSHSCLLWRDSRLGRLHQ